METVLVIMLKNKKTGFLEKELLSLKIDENESYLLNVFAEEDSGKIILHVKLSVNRDVLNWEYDAIFDYYDLDIFKDLISSGLIIDIIEDTESYNPTWELTLPHKKDVVAMEDILTKILNLHKNELNDVFDVIKDKEKEYTNYEN